MAIALENYFNTGAYGPYPVNTNTKTGGNMPATQTRGTVPTGNPGGGFSYRPTQFGNNFSSMQSSFGGNYDFSSLPSGNDMVQGSLEAMLNPGSSYIRNARQRGAEYAASRGGINSSIAAGAAERSAIEAAAPLVEQAVGIDERRQQAQQRNWLESQSFNRQFMGELSLMPVKNATTMLQMVQQQALNDPALYTPDVISGYSNFFNENANNLFSRYFGGT